MIRVLVAASSSENLDRLLMMLRSDRDIEICTVARNGPETLEAIRRVRPQIVVMGISLRVLDAFETTKQIMIEMPTAIVVVADQRDSYQVELSVRALRAGALTVIPLPEGETDLIVRQFVSTVKSMSDVKVVRHWRRPPLSEMSPVRPSGESARIVAIAASTGGPAALQKLLSELPADFPAPILIVQHISHGFVAGLAAWLNTVCSLKVKIADDQAALAPHTVYLASDGHHLGVSSRSIAVLSNEIPIDGFRPSATFLFDSVGRAFGSRAVGVVLTGMGRDGVEGLRTMRRLGSRVIAQDEASSVVFGMPGAAVNAGVVHHVLPLAAIPSKLIALANHV